MASKHTKCCQPMLGEYRGRKDEEGKENETLHIFMRSDLFMEFCILWLVLMHAGNGVDRGEGGRALRRQASNSRD